MHKKNNKELINKKKIYSQTRKIFFRHSLQIIIFRGLLVILPGGRVFPGSWLGEDQLDRIGRALQHLQSVLVPQM